MDDWLTGLTTQVAANLEHYRRTRGLTRTELARRATDSGLPTRRPALAGLLDGARQTVTLQELVVFAQVLDVSVAELVAPLRNGAEIVVDQGEPVHAYIAAQRLFGIPSNGRLEASPTYGLLVRYVTAVDRLATANKRLIALSHSIATGAEATTSADGRPHPASEILAAEAAASRLVAALRALKVAGIAPPPTDLAWSFVPLETAPNRLPVLDHATDADYPIFLYHLSARALPMAELLRGPPAVR